MRAETIILILALCLLVCVAVLILSTAYFLWQWKRMDTILEEFWQDSMAEKEDGSHTYSMEQGTGRRSAHSRRLQRKSTLRNINADVLETRESRIISQLRRILSRVRFVERQAMEDKNQVMKLISDLSHQLKTPLANIMMNMEFLQNAALEEERRKEFLAHTKSQADKMQWLMADLLKASRLENGMIRFTAEYTGIKETVAKAVSSVFAQASSKNMKLIVEDFQDFNLYHNPKWTAEAMSNILENAVKYSPENSSVRITFDRLDIYTKITISDEGIGIPQSDFNRIFKRFYRGKEVEGQEGSGLGLYLAQLILQCEKGYITVSSNAGKGSSFSLFLLNEPK